VGVLCRPDASGFGICAMNEYLLVSEPIDQGRNPGRAVFPVILSQLSEGRRATQHGAFDR